MSSVFKWYNIVRILINETLQAGKSICSRLASSIQTTLEQLIYNVLRFILLGEVGNSFLTTWLIHFTVAFTIVIVAYVAKFLRKIDYPSFDEAEDDVDLPTCWVDWSAAWNDNTPVELDLPTASKRKS
ncbi:hypothetical protein EON65_22945 [archaeon]|nr:MAG: hypothetical protein EON65_22945 [archaeon]